MVGVADEPVLVPVVGIADQIQLQHPVEDFDRHLLLCLAQSKGKETVPQAKDLHLHHQSHRNYLVCSLVVVLSL